MEIVPFTPGDTKTTVSFMKAIAREMGWPEAPEELYNFEKFFHLPQNGFLLLIKDMDSIMGTAGCIKISAQDLLLKRFYIKQNLRGSGIAQKLFDKVLFEAKKFHSKRIVIDVSKKNPRAIHFYEKNGFRQYDQQPIDGWDETRLPDIFNYYFLEL